MSYVLMLCGVMLMLFRESDVFSSDWKTVLLGISAGLVLVASALTQNNIYKNETRIENLKKEIERLKEEKE